VPAAADGTPAEDAPAAEAPAPLLPPHRPRPSQFGTLALIFLVPYSVIITVCFLYLLYAYRTYKAADPLERMLDPSPKDGGARKVQRFSPDEPLGNQLKTSLREPIRVGDLEVKPLGVRRTRDGDLVLRLEMRNLSRDTAFNPFPASFARRAVGRKPYTYLEAGGRAIVGGFVEWLRGPPGHEKPLPGGELRPGQELIARLSTPMDPATRERVQKFLEAPGPFLWRLHVRRGFIEVRGRAVSGTAVIGVRFARADIDDRRQQAAARPARFPLRTKKVLLSRLSGSL
jgi:hypothetical protein